MEVEIEGFRAKITSISISITLRSIPPKSITMYTLSIFVPTTISLTLINKM